MQQKKPVVYAWIFARGGSKGLLRKNVRMLGDKPLIAHAIELGLKSDLIDQVFVSTDDVEIAEVSEKYGARVPFMRPAELASDQAAERLAWRHAIEWVKKSGLPDMNVMVSLPPTSPLRTVEEVDMGIKLFCEGEADTVFAVSRSDRHPSFNMVNIKNDGTVALVLPLAKSGARRQDFPPVYNISTAFYVTSPEFVMKTDSLWAGVTRAIEIPAAHAVDIDSLMDFQLAEILLQTQKEQKTL